MKFYLLICAFMVSTNIANAQTHPAITSWIQNRTGAVNPTYTSLECNVQSVYYSSTFAYLNSSSIPGYAIGPWVANPNTPADMNNTSKFTLSPSVNNGTKTNTGLGAIGLWTNGVQIYNAKDGQHWNNSTSAMTSGIDNSGAGWNRNAYYWEGVSFDNCKGHPGPNGGYHHHISPACLYNQSASSTHSPIIGFAWDGFPIYGCYGYTNTNGTGAIKRITSSYVLSTATSRLNGPPVNSTYPLGSMCEDYVYTAGAGDLDQYNGRTCVTPEYPGGTYAYFATLDANGTPAYPFVLASQYYGTVPAGSNTNVTIPSTGVTQYIAATLPVIIYQFTAKMENDHTVSLYWSVGSEQQVKQYEVQRCNNAIDFVTINIQNPLAKSSYQVSDATVQNGKYYYRIKTVDLDGSIKYSEVVTVSIDNKKHLLIHNNPARDILTIQEDDALTLRNIDIVDMSGKIVLHAKMAIGVTMQSFDIQTIYSGMYVVRISNGKTVQTSKLVIRKY